VSAPAIAATGEVYVGGFGGGVWAVSPAGAVQWTSAAFASQFVFGTPALTADGTIYFVDTNAMLYAVNGSGGLLWTQAINGQTIASPAVGPDGTVYVGSSSGGLAAIQGSSPLATGGWPMFMHDLSHSGHQP
jgi:outer membrane protein assembly factor BamB